ncbi:MAG: DUF1772 domain-containing protein [Phycisphaerales bacterium JB039]
MAELLIIVALILTLACGAITGVFYAFSTIVMNGLGGIPRATGMAAMKAINNAVYTRLFLIPYLGAALLCALVLIIAPFAWRPLPAAFAFLGAAAYIGGTFVVTILCNVPLNNRLAEAKPDDSETAAFWDEYLQRWTMWNHVRAGAALAATAFFFLAIWA